MLLRRWCASQPKILAHLNPSLEQAVRSPSRCAVIHRTFQITSFIQKEEEEKITVTIEGANGESQVKKTEKVTVDPALYTEEIKVKMPDMGEGQGRILQWFKQEGDVVVRRDILCDIETDDFTFGMVSTQGRSGPSESEGLSHF